MLNQRDPQGLTQERFDLIVVGGGVYGIMVLLEAARRGLRALLLERGDFGAETSYNSLRIVHGGLRYLQTLDLIRHRESVAERRWFLRHFPELVEPLPCLMPLHGAGLRRPWVFRAALRVNDVLSGTRNAGVTEDHALPASRVLSVKETHAACPGMSRDGLRAAAEWHDAFIPNMPRMFIETLHWACAHGAFALNHVEARGVIATEGAVAGVCATDVISGAELTFHADVVVNATGPWGPAFADACGADRDGLFEPSLAWNVVFDCPPPAAHALAVRTRRPGARTYFLVPWKGVLLAGTGHAGWTKGGAAPVLPPDLLHAFIGELNEALPSLNLGEADVLRVFAGLVPTGQPGSGELLSRDVIVDHGARGGPRGLFSLAGVKLTTARRVADKALRRAFPSAQARPFAAFPRPAHGEPAPDHSVRWMPEPGDEGWKDALRVAIAGEAVEHLEDLLLRRSSLGDNPARAAALAPEAARLFDWDDGRAQREVARLRHSLDLPAEDLDCANAGK